MELQLSLITGFSVGFEIIFVDPMDYGEFNAEKIVGIDLGILRLTFFI